MRFIFLSFLLLGICGCLGMPDDVRPVDDFDINRYQGTWYEIARLDHSFERGLKNVTATYSLRDDGGVTVMNKGFSIKSNRWKEIKGKAYFVGNQAEGYLKVSFFWPFYGSYIVFDIDADHYEYAFVSGNTKSYLWLLARSPHVEESVIDLFIEKAHALGFDTERLIFVEHAAYQEQT